MTDTQTKKTYEELDFTDDFMFCKIMQTKEEICREILELVIGKKINIIRYPEKQKTIEITSDGKGIRLDVYVEDDQDVIYDVEMQTSSKSNLPKRSRYYQGMIDLNLIERGADYNELKKSYIIFICTFDFLKKGLHKYTFSNACEELQGLYLEDDAKKVFLCAGGAADDVSQEMKDFLDYLAEKKINNKLTEELDHAVEEARKHEKWRNEFMTLLMRDQENQAIGKEIGEKIGKEIGKETERRDIIEKMMKKGYTVEQIADILDESPQSIEKLIEEKN